MHATDVAQLSFAILVHGKMWNKFGLSYLEMVSVIISAACHDVEHDGFTNTFHVNGITERSMRYHE